MVDAFKIRGREISQRTVSAIRKLGVNIRIMHVCGGHQDALVRFGLDSMLADSGVEVRQGPGCPVCVTPTKEIEEVLQLARHGLVVTVFGDMMRVPGVNDTFFDARAKGADIRMVYSIDEAVAMAYKDPHKSFVFMAVGFETTAPTTAAAVIAGLPDNFTVLSSHRTVPRALRGIIESGEVALNGFIQPGHVSAIIGTRPYDFISKEFRMPQVVAGFEPMDILMATLMLAKQHKEGRAELENSYSRVVRRNGNKKALDAMGWVFEPCDMEWRGFGVIPDSGLRFRPEFEALDARKVHEYIFRTLDGVEFKDPPGCICGEVLRGVKTSRECGLFGTKCTPETPVGPCMVTGEGSCAIEYKYRRSEG